MKTYVACLVLMFIAFHNVDATKFEVCESKTPPSAKVTSVEVSDCPDSVDKCILKKGTNKTVEIVFVPTAAAKNVTAKLVGCVYVPFYYHSQEIKLPNPDACVSGGLNCPLEDGKSNTYKQTLEIDASIYITNIDIKAIWHLYDENEADIVCVEIASRLEG